MAESFFATLKTGSTTANVWPTQASAKLAVGAWIEDRYNRRRRHSALGQVSPVTFEMTHCTQTAAVPQVAYPVSTIRGQGHAWSSLPQTISMRMLIAYNGATAGLGNRMRVTLGAANLASATDRRFGYVWPRGSSFEPRLQDLWSWRDGVVIPRAISRGLSSMSGYFDDDVRAIRDADQNWLWQIRTGGQLQLPTGVAPWYETFRTLRPVQPIVDTVTKTFSTSLAGRRYVGVMIRAHAVSPERTKKSSPVEWFVDRMSQLLDTDPGLHFFVSADVPEVKRNILDRFPTATAIMHSHPYNSTPAVRCAVADLYLLASSSYMIGPHASSFIEMAQYLTDLKVPTEKSNEFLPKLAPQDIPIAHDPLRPFER